MKRSIEGSRTPNISILSIQPRGVAERFRDAALVAGALVVLGASSVSASSGKVFDCVSPDGTDHVQVAPGRTLATYRQLGYDCHRVGPSRVSQVISS